MSEPRISNETLEKAIIGQGNYFASFRAGIDCIGGIQAKAGYDALLDLRDARAELSTAQEQLRIANTRIAALEQARPKREEATLLIVTLVGHVRMDIEQGREPSEEARRACKALLDYVAPEDP